MKRLKLYSWCLVALLLGIGPLLGPLFLWAASVERDRAGEVCERPSEISFTDLVSGGPLDNRHIIVSNVAISADGYAWQWQGRSEDRVIAYVPAYSALADSEPDAAGFQLIVKAFGVTGEDDLFELVTSGPVTGILDAGYFPIEPDKFQDIINYGHRLAGHDCHQQGFKSSGPEPLPVDETSVELV